ncbi:hypothetical protein NM208_g861 [Fusarium decemcellulare]|uniref:Uncharacterized protein n=1 Tax=Fusarium decemcellulare TaxID=57161 RepID=A0ACC1SYP8_9HYPO|nr:hypothetical protein NM208_g861 [Fusarium decemcellulare]
MDPYFAALVVLGLLLSSSSVWQWKPRPKGLSPQDQPFPGPGKYLNFTTTRYQDFCRFRNHFLRVYALAVAADWLQGSFIYSLYRNTHKLSESSVASLFATGYLWGALSGGITGALADRYGRKLACITYCVIYSASCLTCLTHNLPLLFLGRALGGISTTLLSTVFETWMVAQFHQLGFESSDGLLSDILGSMSTVNGAVAVTCGIVAQALVSISGSEQMPFLVSIICLCAAGGIMWRSWPENYRQKEQVRSDDPTHYALPSKTTLQFTGCKF